MVGQPEAMVGKWGFELETSLGGDFRHGGEMFTDQTMLGQPGAMMGAKFVDESADRAAICHSLCL